MNPKINVIGLGYIGLPTALMLAAHGVEVVGTDYNKNKKKDRKISLKKMKNSRTKRLFFVFIKR